MFKHFPQVGAADFAWAGPGRSTDQRNKFRVNYDECRVNGVTIRSGDFVLLGKIRQFFYFIILVKESELRSIHLHFFSFFSSQRAMELIAYVK